MALRVPTPLNVAMISLYASGGLGNQLFNYAAARTLADRHDVPLVIDAVAYRDQWVEHSPRPLELHRFPTRARFRNVGASSERQSVWRRLLRRVREDAFTVRVSRRAGDIGYFDEFASLGSRVILDGHFIDPRFFAGNEIAIRSDLALSDNVIDADPALRSVLDSIVLNPEPVAVHVRRGDLLATANDWLCLPRMHQYYEEAIRAIASQFPAATLWVFSDDPEWCRRAFSDCVLPVTVVSSIRNHDALREFHLMTRCKHHIIANSAFSWWSAWLCSHEHKTVIAPYRWDLRDAVDMAHFLPSSWRRIVW